LNSVQTRSPVKMFGTSFSISSFAPVSSHGQPPPKSAGGGWHATGIVILCGVLHPEALGQLPDPARSPRGNLSRFAGSFLLLQTSSSIADPGDASMAHHVPASPNKILKEQFVSNLTGSSMLEIAALSTIVPALVVLRQWSGFCFVADENRAKKDDNVTKDTLIWNWRTYMISLVADYAFTILPILLIFTVFADWAYSSTMTLLFLLLVFFLAKSRTVPFSINDVEGFHASPLKNSLLSYRVCMMVVTCLCILAVDFKIFPRRYAKTETHGTGLVSALPPLGVKVSALDKRKRKGGRLHLATKSPHLSLHVELVSLEGFKRNPNTTHTSTLSKSLWR
ncbi:hypothetical protein Taro_042826, partial [Colocasia esculenta]|nr:hypothetical protein [Colocasia esculenta]